MGPALRVGDTALCPLFDGPKPHVGGPITPAAESAVLIGNQPAAVANVPGGSPVRVTRARRDRDGVAHGADRQLPGGPPRGHEHARHLVPGPRLPDESSSGS